MTRTTHAAAFALSLLVTLALFSGVAQLSTPSYTGAALVQSQTGAPALRG